MAHCKAQATGTALPMDEDRVTVTTKQIKNEARATVTAAQLKVEERAMDSVQLLGRGRATPLMQRNAR
uniref:Uncharacterized protein n=1 Tax=Peronospora matthiolae TaxID=2874970 RepID=A0AAV1TJL9_9STRA